MADLSVENVSKHFPTPTEPLEVLRDVTLNLARGQNMAVLGPSGSGKSTLLHLLGTLDRPSGGEILLDGENPFSLSEAKLAHFRNRNIGFIFQDHHLLPQLNVIENILIPAVADGKPGLATVNRARELLDRVGLSDRINHRPAELSGGERERIAVARALVRKPILVLADEPTGNLDQRNARAIGSLLLEVQRDEQNMLVVVTHSLELARTMDQVYELNDGRMAARNLSGESSGTNAS